MPRTNDPQIVVTGTIKEGSQGELLTFSIPLGKYFELVCIANIPADGETQAPVYVKHKIRNHSPRPQGAVESDKSDKPEGEGEEEESGD
jgi:hypothetical protein